MSRSPYSSSFPRFGLSEARKTEIKRENRLKQELYNRQKTIQFSNLLERSGKDLDDYIESQENVFFSNGAKSEENADFDATDGGAEIRPFETESSSEIEPAAVSDADSNRTFVSDDGEIGDDVFNPHFSGNYARRLGGASDGSEFEFDPVARSQTSLRERLEEQIRLDAPFDAERLDDSQTIRRFCEEIVDRLDANGMLTVFDVAPLEENEEQISVFDAIFDLDSTADERIRAKNALDDYFTSSTSKVARRFAREEFDAIVGHKSTKEEREAARAALDSLFAVSPDGSKKNGESAGADSLMDALLGRRLTSKERELAEKALQLVRSFDPPGVGAFNLQDGLRLRLRPDATFRKELERLLEDDVFDDFCKKRFASLSEKTGFSRETLERIYAAPFPFFPAPETLFSADSVPPTIRAEVVVEKNDSGRWLVRLDETRDSFELDPQYRKMLLAKKIDSKAKEYLRKQYVEARALLDALTSRDATLLRVAKAVVDFQYDWLDEPTSFPRPLTQQQIADKIGLDPSTISRACNDKWLATPRGFVPFKAFFPKAVAGEETTSDVAAKIRKIVENENRESPFNDDAISERLRVEFGVKISRKTVQEHRERLQIPNSRERKRIYSREK